MSHPVETTLSETPTPSQHESPTEGSHGEGTPLKAQLADILASLQRLAKLEISIWVTKTKLAVVRMVLFVILLLLALLLAIIAVIFLYAGVYHVLTDVLSIPAHWALLIFAGVHFVFAGVFTLVAISLLKRGGGRKKTAEGPS